MSRFDPSHAVGPSHAVDPSHAVGPSHASAHLMPSAWRPVGRSAAGSCTLRDTFLGDPASVCPGHAKTLSHRVQVRDAPPRPAGSAKPAVANVPARARGPTLPASASRPVGRSATESCTLRDTFLGHPASVCPGRAKTLSHRVQVRDAPRRPAGPAKHAVANIPARACGPTLPASALRPVGRSTTESCTLRDTFLGHPASVCPGRAKTLSYRAQVRDAPPRPAGPATRKTSFGRVDSKEGRGGHLHGPLTVFGSPMLDCPTGPCSVTLPLEHRQNT